MFIFNIFRFRTLSERILLLLLLSQDMAPSSGEYIVLHLRSLHKFVRRIIKKKTLKVNATFYPSSEYPQSFFLVLLWRRKGDWLDL